MTYSRPTTSTVDALARVPTPNAPGIIGDSRVTSSANGRVIDARNPGQLVANGRAQAAEVTNFIEGLTKVAQPLINDALTKQANNQVGELLKTQDPVQLLRSAKPEDRALIRNLSPQAQAILEDKAAQGSVRLYQDTLTAESTKRAAILQSPTATPEDKAKARADAKAAALEASGVNQMPAGPLVKYADALSQADAAIAGLDYKETLKNQDKDNRVKFSNGITAGLDNLSRLWKVYGTKSEDDQIKIAGQVKTDLEGQIVADSATYTPADQAQVYGEVFAGRIKALTTAGRYDDAITLADTMESLMALGVQTPSGVDFFDQKLSNGYTLRYLVNETSKGLENDAKQWRREQAVESSRDAIQAALRGEPGADAAFQNVLGTFKTADEMLAAAGAFNQADAIGSKPTNAQIQKEAELRYEIAQGNFKPEEMWQRVQGAGLRPQQVLGLAGTIQSGAAKPTQLVAGAREYLGQEIVSAADSIIKAAGITNEDDARSIGRDLLTSVSRSTEQRIQQELADGKPVDAERARDIFRNELEATRNTRLKEAGDLKSVYQNTPDRRTARELQELQQNVRNSGGEVTVMSFPPTVRQGFQAAFPNQPMSVPRLEKFMMTRMQGVKEGDKPVYADPQKTLKEIYKGGKDQALQGANPAQRYGMTMGPILQASPLGTLLQKVGEGLEATKSGIESMRNGSSKPSPTGPQSSAKPQTNPVMAVVGSGLELVSRTVMPPAAAATRQGAPTVVNAETVATLNRIWKKREPLSIQTPPLPQVAATAPVQFAPLQINSDKHPMFIAIGISEGTRTANGGYTRAYYGHKDPGNGVWNVGTVSGQQGGSPAGSDRRWMGTLTRQSMSVAPILQRIGLQPGTQGWNRVLFNVLDLTVQAPAAARDFIAKLPGVVRAGATIEAIAKARADSFFNPATGRLDAGGFGNSYNRLFADQRSRAGVWDYRRRI